LGVNAGEAIISTAKALLSPFQGLNFNLGWGKGESGQQEYYTPDPHDPVTQQDVGYALAERLLPIVHRFAELLTHGPDELKGVDWERLAGRGEPMNGIRSLQSAMRETMRQFFREQSNITRQVRVALKPAEEVRLHCPLNNDRYIN
jgi:hypothetical protein